MLSSLTSIDVRQAFQLMSRQIMSGKKPDLRRCPPELPAA